MFAVQNSASSQPMLSITSAQNPIIKLIRSLSEKKFRRETGLFVAEGWDMLNRARKQGWVPEHLLSTEPISPWGEAQPLLVSEKIVASLSSQSNPHSALATFKQRYASGIAQSGVWVALEHMRDPGNLGTIIRTADAVGGQRCGARWRLLRSLFQRLRAGNNRFHFWRSSGADGNTGLCDSVQNLVRRCHRHSHEGK